MFDSIYIYIYTVSVCGDYALINASQNRYEFVFGTTWHSVRHGEVPVCFGKR